MLDAQRRLEHRVVDGDLLERGFVDPIDYATRRVGSDATQVLSYEPLVDYRVVFLFDVLAGVQRSLWGYSAEERESEAVRINEGLAAAYRTVGCRVVRVPPGDVVGRAALVAQIAEDALAPRRSR